MAVDRRDPFRDLPAPPDTDRISALMEEGELTIEVPEVEQASPRRIEMKASQT